MLARVRVKICGITEVADALLAAELGADALGFIFYSKSPRYLTPADARAIIAQLPPFITPVAVMVNESLEVMQQIMLTSGCRVAQLHGEEPPASFALLGWPAMKGLSVATPHDLEAISCYPEACAILLDTKVAGQYGGTGKAFDWHIAREATRFGRPIVLAGGLHPDNITEAIAIAQPYAVDISSGVEAAPGRKDHARLRQLFAAINAR